MTISGKTVSLRAAAETLGVHYMTAYRYVRLGMLPASKVGASWHVNVLDLETFQSADSQPLPRKRADWDARFKDRLIAGDLSGAWGVVEAALSSGMDVTDFYMKVLTPAMHQIGAQWEAGEVDVATEHRASGIAHRILGRLGHRMTRRGRTRGGVVVGTPAAELHGLPVAMLADLLRSGGWEVMDLGCDLPPESFVNAARDADRLTALGISVTNGDNAGNVRGTIQALRTAFPQTPILLGGIAVAAEWVALDLGADYWARDGIAALAILDEIAGGKSAVGRSAG